LKFMFLCCLLSKFSLVEVELYTGYGALIGSSVLPPLELLCDTTLFGAGDLAVFKFYQDRLIFKSDTLMLFFCSGYTYSSTNPLVPEVGSAPLRQYHTQVPMVNQAFLSCGTAINTYFDKKSRRHV